MENQLIKSLRRDRDGNLPRGDMLALGWGSGIIPPLNLSSFPLDCMPARVPTSANERIKRPRPPRRNNGCSPELFTFPAERNRAVRSFATQVSASLSADRGYPPVNLFDFPTFLAKGSLFAFDAGERRKTATRQCRRNMALRKWERADLHRVVFIFRINSCRGQWMGEWGDDSIESTRRTCSGNDAASDAFTALLPQQIDFNYGRRVRTATHADWTIVAFNPLCSAWPKCLPSIRRK